MDNYYIKRITLTGRNVQEAIIDLDNGLNIIYGPSNTGKSYIAECINFMFGSSAKSLRIDKDTGYDCVQMLVSTTKGDIHLKRYFGENKIYVRSFHPDIASGKYSISAKGKLSINNLWLYLMGIEYSPEIIKNENFVRYPLTVRTFLHIFLLGEDNIIQNNSILFHRSGFSKTAILSALLYLMTGNALSEYDTLEDKSIKEAKKNAVIDYINSHLSRLAIDKNEIQGIKSPDIYTAHKEITEIIDEIENTEEDLSIAITRSRQLAKEIYKVNDQLAEANMLYNRYQVLAEQYESDINRLTFILEGELHKEDFVESSSCPICDNDFERADIKSCAEAAKAELQKIIYQYIDLKDTEKDILLEKEQLDDIHSSLQRERELIEETINSDLRPKVKRLRSSLDRYRQSIRVDVESSVIHRFEHTMITDLKELDVDDEAEKKYRPKDHFSSDVINIINVMLSHILDTCNFDNYSSSYFSKETFDVVVNGKHKAKYGKGYRAFLNTVVALTFMEYFTECGAFSPGMLIIDSPILSLKEKGSEQASDSMKKSLFRYFINNQGKGQKIIIENEIPDLDYSTANLIHFTKDTEVGRYGLLHGVTE